MGEPGNEALAPHQALQRINAKGERGIFACTDCGKEGFFDDLRVDPCRLPRSLSQSERLMRAILGKHDG